MLLESTLQPGTDIARYTQLIVFVYLDEAQVD